MATGKINIKPTMTANISGNKATNASISSGGVTDHSRLFNRDAENQHPISAIENLEKILDSKLDSTTALPLINEAVNGRAKGLYFDAMKELAKKSYWYLTSEIDPVTKMGTKNSIISGPYDLGMGGGSGGGGGGITTVSIKPYEWPTAAVVGGTTKIKINWSSVKGDEKEPTGVGTLYLTVNNKQVEVRPKQEQGIVEFDVSEYIISGSNNIQVKVLDMYGTTGITIGTISGILLDLTSKFENNIPFEGEINYTYTPIGNVTKTVYFYLDGKLHGQQTVKVSDEVQTYILKDLSHGAHTLEVFFKANIQGESVESKHLFYDLIYIAPGNTIPIIASEFRDLEQVQYLSFNIPYRVYIYDRNMAPVSLSINGKVVRSYEVNTTDTHIWPCRIDEPGLYELTISCGKTSKTFNVTVAESEITVTPVSEGLALALSAHGRSNNESQEERTTWSYTNDRGETYNCTFTDFNWSSDGWILDTDGNSVLSVGGAARVEIPMKLFANDFKANGKTIELEIATCNIRDYDTTIISCLDNVKTPFYSVEEFLAEEEFRLKGFEINYNYSILTNAGLALGKHMFSYDGTGWFLNGNRVNLNDYGITLSEITLNPEGEDLGVVVNGDRIIVNYSLEARGFKITPQLATIRSQQSLLSTQYKEDEHIRITFVVEQAAQNRIIWMYINGVASGAMQYPVDDTFKQEDPATITIGSSDAIVDIYNIRVYNNSLNNKQVVNNWIADTQDAAVKTARWSHNNILSEQGEILVENLPADLPYIIWDIDPLPQYKGDKRLGNARYVDPSNPERNFTVEDGEYNVQGTSSSVYPTKNIRLRMRSKNGPGYAWYDDNGDTIEEFPITYPGGIGANYFTFKVDYASSEGANNVELTKLYNDASLRYGIITPPQYQQYSKWNKLEDINVRVGIDGFPIAAFHQDKDGNVKFHTKANFNNDKANEDVYGFADGDESWETTNNSAAEAKYQVPVTVDNFDRGFEIRFPDKDGYNNMSKLGPMTAWVYSTYRDLATNEPLKPEVEFTYTETVKSEAGSFATTTVTKKFTHDTEEYRLTKFKAELPTWFNVDSCLFYYLFTELFLMIDSRAKNAFPTYFATRTNELAKDEDGNIIAENTFTDGGNRWYWIPYDMDTAIGIDNKGKLSFDYYLEDTDQLDGADVYNGQTSVMWCNIRDAFAGELAAMYAELRTQGLIDYDYVESLFEAHQGKWPEVLLNVDSYNKYIVPLKSGDNYLEMLQGLKEQQRKWWLYNRFKYTDSKYLAGDARADFIQFRAYVDIGEEKPNITITPYANIYATASFGNGDKYTVSKRVENRNEAITLENPFGIADDENDQETYIYSASQLKSIGDISGFHPDTVKIGNAIRLQDLKVGDASSSYKNPHLKELTLGANTLLRTVDARNCVNLGTGTTVAPDLSQCTNIEEIYFSGTKIKGITLPDGGTIKKLHLPGTLVSLTIKNQPLLTDLVIDSTNTTITNSAENADGYTFSGLAVEKEPWNDTNANANIYLADSTEASAQRIRISIIDRDLYNEIVENQSILSIICTHIDARFDLIDETAIELAEYSTRFISSAFINMNATTNIESLIEAITPFIKVPELKDFSTSLIETLWLEGIPSSAIKARKLIENMKDGTEVRLIGINEYYDSWEDIEEFYNLLDRHYGINFSDSEIKPKAQVTGTININSNISYAKFVELTARYPEVKIVPNQIICTAVFMNEGAVFNTQNISINTVLSAPNIPTKTSTQAHYYVFDKWIYSDTLEAWAQEDLIDRDVTLIATYIEKDQEYKITFDPNSDIISVEPLEQILVYNSKLIAPSLTNIPEGVELEGWFVENGTKWDFENFTLLDHTTLIAKWKDSNAPTVNITVQNATHFKYEASDNLGIVGWAVTVDSEEEPVEWFDIKSTTVLSGIYEVTQAGINTFWIKDSNNNTAHASIAVYLIDVKTSIGIESYSIFEGDLPLNNIAITNTVATIKALLGNHYKDLSIKINNQAIAENSEFIVNKDIIIELTCLPKQYIVSFDLGDKGIAIPNQVITYLDLAIEPLNQYWAETHEVISGWYLDPDYQSYWAFNTSITSDIILYAKWERLQKPSEITIFIPEDEATNQNGKYEVEVVYKNGTDNLVDLVRIDFGDGEERTSPNIGTNYLKYEYDTPGEKLIKIYGNNKGYVLGGGSAESQIVNPSRYIIKANLSWDISKITNNAFKGSSLTEAPLSDYITIIGDGAFMDCNKLTNVALPRSLLIIDRNAFKNCNSLNSIQLSERLIEIGDSAFEDCTALTTINFNGNNLKTIGSYAFTNTNLEAIDLPVSVETTGVRFLGSNDNLQKVILRNPNLVVGNATFMKCPNLQTAGPIGSLDSEGYPVNIEYAWTKKIPNEAFAAGQGESSLIEIILPDTLEVIGERAFRWSLITKIDLPQTLKEIGNNAFTYARQLQEITIPASVESIGAKAFSYTNGLTTATLLMSSNYNPDSRINIPEDGWFLSSNKNCKIYVSSSIFNEELGILPKDYFGEYWNLYNNVTKEEYDYIALDD